jgi:hypothetical protein
MTTNGPALLIDEPVAASTNAMPSELHDIRPAVEIVSLWEYAGWAFLTLALIVLAYFLVRYFLKNRDQKILEKASRPTTPAHILARKRLDAALEHLHDARLFCGLVSDAIRVYLEDRFDLRAPERTTEEFLEELQSSESLNASQKETLQSFLQQCDLAKFAKADMLGKELQSLHEIGVQFVGETEPESISAPGAKLEQDAQSTVSRPEKEGSHDS